MGTVYVAAPISPLSFTPAVILLSSSESTDLRDRDFVVPDMFSIGGRLTTSDVEVLRRNPIVTLAIQPVAGGSTQDVICVKTPLGVPWIGKGLQPGKTYVITPWGALNGPLYIFRPDFVRVDGPRNDLSFSVFFDAAVVLQTSNPCR